MFTSRQVAEILSISQAQVRLYARAALHQPHRDQHGCYRFSFQDLVVLRTSVTLASVRLSHCRIRRALQHLKYQLPSGQPLTSVAFDVDGNSLLARTGDAIWNPESGQMCFPFDETRSHSVDVQPYDSAKREDTARRAYERGCELEETSPAEAQLMYRQAIAKDPKHVHARINLGRLLHKNGRFADAIDHYLLALLEQPENATATYNLGVAYQDSERTVEAIDVYHRAIQYDPAFADAHYNLAFIYEQQNDIVGALRHLKIYRKLKK